MTCTTCTAEVTLQFAEVFSSCTTCMSVLQSDRVLENTVARTMFHIKCNTAKGIR
jgi:hypothetical protein